MPCSRQECGRNRGLTVGDRDGSRGHCCPGDIAPRQCKQGIVHPDIRVTGRKTETKHHAARAGVDADDLLFGDADFPGNFAQVRTVFAAIANWDLDLSRRSGGLDEIRTERVTNLLRERAKVGATEIDTRLIEKCDGGVGGHDVRDALKSGALQCRCCGQAELTGFKADGVTKVNAETAVALGAQSVGDRRHADRYTRMRCEASWQRACSLCFFLVEKAAERLNWTLH